MEPHCLSVETPTTASSSSTDPLYDNCPPFTQRGRDGEKEMESRVVCPAVTRLQGPCSPPLALAPAVAEVPTAAGGGRGAGGRPDRSYCSWRGGLGRAGWDSEQDPGAGRGGEQGGGWRSQYRDDRGGRYQSPSPPSPPSSPEHRSTLSLYDNLPDPATPDSIQDAFEMETGFAEGFEEPVNQARVPGRPIQGVFEDEEGSEERSPWSSCEIILADGGSANQDQNPDPEGGRRQEPERDSASCGFTPADLMRHEQRSRPRAQLPICQASCRAAWPRAEAGGPEQPPRASRVPPPVPPADPSASALRSLLTSLQQQIVRQREEYEARIMSLEQRNEELQVEVVRLRTNLAQQRHWYQAVQAKIAEAEQERAAAEQHNSSLQKDMEQSFDTFGELNSEAKKTEYIVKSF